MKTCSKCSRKYPATTEYFYKDRDCIGGLCCWCKEHSRDNDGHYEKGNIEFLSDKEHRQKHKKMKGADK